LEGVEEDHEEDQHGGQEDLRGRSQGQRDDEDRPEHDPWDRVQHLDIRADHLRQERALSEQHAGDHAGDHAVEEAEQRLLHRDPDLQPKRPVLSAVLDPVTQLLDYPARLAEEERVHDFQLGEQLPAADDHHEERDAGGPYCELPVFSALARPDGDHRLVGCCRLAHLVGDCQGAHHRSPSLFVARAVRS
jgi:hypothetical protein